jgi:hypothetical protein
VNNSAIIPAITATAYAEADERKYRRPRVGRNVLPSSRGHFAGLRPVQRKRRAHDNGTRRLDRNRSID